MSDNVNEDELLFESTINKLGDTRSYTKWENIPFYSRTMIAILELLPEGHLPDYQNLIIWETP
jgi:hypothetical protein